MAESVVEAVPPQIEQLDPFAYHPDIGSRIGGLALGQIGHDPNYVFHTDYVPVGSGMALARLQFTGLRAKLGTLMVRVHMLTGGEPARLVMINSDRIALARLVHLGGEMTISFEGFGDCKYALYGAIVGDTDATAEGLAITVRLPHRDERIGSATEARNSDFGRKETHGIAHLTSVGEPSIETPVTQLATCPQMASRAAREWLRELAPVAPDAWANWPAVYMLQALKTYGVLAAGARGLGIGDRDDALVAVLERHGCVISTEAEPAEEPGEVSGARSASSGLVDMDALGTNLVNFDFLWHWDADGRVAARQQWSLGIERALTALLPGGLAIFTFGFDHTAPTRTFDIDGPRRIGRGEVDQLALILISRDHQVAQLRMKPTQPLLLHDDDPSHGVCGLIVRRARMAE